MYLVEPVWNDNIGAAYTFFTRRPKDPITKGICIFTPEDNPMDIRVSHAGLVVEMRDGHIWGIEAHANGVKWADLTTSYLDSPLAEFFCMAPVNLTEERAVVIIRKMSEFVGQHYNFAGIGGFFLDIVLQLDHIPGFRRLPSLFSGWGAFCTEALATSYNEVAEYRRRSPLDKCHPSKLSPQRLFDAQWEVNSLYKPWKLTEGADAGRG